MQNTTSIQSSLVACCAHRHTHTCTHRREHTQTHRQMPICYILHKQGTTVVNNLSVIVTWARYVKNLLRHSLNKYKAIPGLWVICCEGRQQHSAQGVPAKDCKCLLQPTGPDTLPGLKTTLVSIHNDCTRMQYFEYNCIYVCILCICHIGSCSHEYKNEVG